MSASGEWSIHATPPRSTVQLRLDSLSYSPVSYPPLIVSLHFRYCLFIVVVNVVVVVVVGWFVVVVVVLFVVVVVLFVTRYDITGSSSPSLYNGTHGLFECRASYKAAITSASCKQRGRSRSDSGW
jgi:hypothetical protein